MGKKSSWEKKIEAEVIGLGFVSSVGSVEPKRVYRRRRLLLFWSDFIWISRGSSRLKFSHLKIMTCESHQRFRAHSLIVSNWRWNYFLFIQWFDGIQRSKTILWHLASWSTVAHVDSIELQIILASKSFEIPEKTVLQYCISQLDENCFALSRARHQSPKNSRKPIQCSQRYIT